MQSSSMSRMQFVGATCLVLTLFLVPVCVAEVGEVVWWELLTEDAEAATQFYEELFGWQFEQVPSGNRIAELAGVPFAGISQIDDQLKGRNEAFWLVGFEVDKAANVVAKSRSQGAISHHSGQLEGVGTYAVLEDNQDAFFMLIEPDRPLGGAAKPWVWAELWTRDIDQAASFYSRLLGYERSEEELASGRYQVLASAEVLRAGLVPIEARKVDPIWAPYLAVDDLDRVMARTETLGGEVLMTPSKDVAAGRVALLEDPTGGAFFVYLLEREDAQ